MNFLIDLFNQLFGMASSFVLFVVKMTLAYWSFMILLVVAAILIGAAVSGLSSLFESKEGE